MFITYRHILLIIFCGLKALLANGQCSVKFLMNDTTVVSEPILSCGDALELTAIALDSSNYIYDEANMVYHPVWDLSMNYAAILNSGFDSMCNQPVPPFITDACGNVLDNTKGYWFGHWVGSNNYAAQYIVTNPLDFSCGGNICFDLKFSDSSFFNQSAIYTCGITGTELTTFNQFGLEGFTLAVSDDNINWTQIHTFDFQIIYNVNQTVVVNPNAQLSPAYEGKRYCFSIPPNMYSPNLRIRLSSKTCENDTEWGIDNIEITPNNCNYYYDWAHIPGAPNSNSITVSPIDTTTYTVYYTNGINDTCSASVTLNVPQFEIDLSPEIDSVGCNDCLPLAATIPTDTTALFTNYTFDWSPANELSSLQGNQVTACMDSTSSMFYLEVTDTTTGCISNDSVQILVNHCGCEYINHTVSIDSCLAGGVYTINGELSFYDYPATGDLIITAQTNSGIYTDTLFQNFVEDSIYNYFISGIPQSGGQISIIAQFEDETTCADTITLQAPDLPIYSVVQSGNTYCQGDSIYDILLDASIDQNATLYYTFNGSPQTMNISTGQVNLGNQEGVYIIDSIQDANCSNYFTDTLQITILTLPNVSAGVDTSICTGDSYILSASGAQTYQWEGGYLDQQVVNLTIGQHQFVVEGTDVNACTNTDTLDIIVNAIPQVSFTVDTLEGCEPLEVTFSNTTSNTQSLVWTIDNTSYTSNQVVHEFNAGLYTVSLNVTDQNNCINTVDYIDYVEVHPNPVADFSMSTNEINTLDNTVSFTNQSTGAINYYWTFGDGNTSTQVNPVHGFIGNSRIVFQIELLATSDEGCTDVEYQSIELNPEMLYYVPNTFTPNGDQSNNTFQPVFTSGIDFTSYRLEIYNRTGKLIFETSDVNDPWDGTYKGHPVPDGTYTYKIYFTSIVDAERQFITGHVNVLR